MNVAAGRPSFPWWLPAATALAYLDTLAAGFQFDDFRVIVDNPRVHGLSAWWEGMPGIRPLLKLSYALNWYASQAPIGFHAVNLLLHLTNVVLVWHLSAHFPAPGDGPQRGRARLAATLLFALHPIQTEAVTYISGRSMGLMALFGLLGLLAWLEAPRRPHPGLWRGGAILALAAAVASKEVALVLPLLLMLLPAWKDAAATRASDRLTPGVLPFLFLILLAGLGYGYLLTSHPPRGLAANLASESNALFYLLGQLVRPHALNIDPDLTEYAGWAPLPVFQAVLLGALLAFSWHTHTRRPWLWFGLAWWLLCLLPMYSLIPRVDLTSERHLYLAGLGLYWIAGVVFARLPVLAPALRWFAFLAGLALLGLLSTAQRNVVYRDEVSLWQATAARSPGKARVWNNLGYAHALAGQEAAARQAFLEALRLDPDHPRAGRNLRALQAGRFARPAAAASPPLSERSPP